MDDLDRKILDLLRENARMTVKEMVGKVALTAPAVAERMRRMEKSGVIRGYTVRLDPELGRGSIQAIISIYVPPEDRERFAALLAGETGVEECYHVTGALSHMVKVRCADIAALDALINRLQKLGQTNTQIVLSALVEAGARPVL